MKKSMETKDINILWIEIKENRIKEKGIIKYWEDRCEQDLEDQEILDRTGGRFGLPHFRNSKTRELYEPVFLMIREISI